MYTLRELFWLNYQSFNKNNATWLQVKIVKYKTLNWPPPMDTSNLWLNIQQFPMKDIQKLAEQSLHIGWMRKNLHRIAGEAKRQAHHKPHPSTAAHDQEWTHNSKTLPEEQRMWTSPKFYALYLKDENVKCLILKVLRIHARRTTRLVTENKTSPGCSPGLSTEADNWKALSLPVRGWFVYFEAPYYRGGISFNIHLGPYWNTLQSLQRLVGTIYALSPRLTPGHQCLPEMSLCTVVASRLLWLTLLDHLALVASLIFIWVPHNSDRAEAATREAQVLVIAPIHLSSQLWPMGPHFRELTTILTRDRDISRHHLWALHLPWLRSVKKDLGHIWHPSFCGRHPDSLDLVASWAMLTGTRGQQQTKTQFLTGSCVRDQNTGNRQKRPCPSHPPTGLSADFKSYCFTVWLPVCLNPDADRDPPLWHWQVCPHPQILWVPKCETSC